MNNTVAVSQIEKYSSFWSFYRIAISILSLALLLSIIFVLISFGLAILRGKIFSSKSSKSE